MQSRTENSIRNTVIAIIGQVVIVLLNFFVRTIFIKFLDVSYLGINGLFSNILSVLSFAEMGFGTAITYALYKPLSTDDEYHIGILMSFYKRVYRAVGGVIFLMGSLLLPFLDFFIGDISELPSDLPPLWIIYLLYLINTVTSYFFNYKRTLIIASQNGYIDSINTVSFSIIQNILQVIVLLVWKNYIMYLLIQIVCTAISNILISNKANKLFPYLNKYRDERIPYEELKPIIKNVIGMSFHKLGAVVVNGTDNILISKFVGILAAGYYSNYYLITNTVRYFYMRCFSPVTASVGNMLATKSGDEVYELFKKFFFINGYIAIVFSSCIASLINPFICLIWGREYTFGLEIVLLIVLNFYITCIRQTCSVFMDASGLFWEVRWKSIIESLVNLIASIVLAKSFGLGVLGVVLGTTISTLATNFWWEPYAIYKHTLSRKLSAFFVLYIKYFLLFSASVALSVGLGQILNDTFGGFAIKSFITILISNSLILLSFRGTVEMQFLICVVKKILRKILRRKR